MAIVPSWIEAHCVVPDGFRFGAPFRLYNYQLLYIANFYLVRGSAVWVPEAPILAPSFVYRSGLIGGPQKLGKDPMKAAQICVEGVGPVVFADWAGKDEGYACADWGCGCGWEYAYEPGEPKGMRWPTPRIQIAGLSEDNTDNTYGALRPMIDNGPLHDLIPKTGEEFIRLPGVGDSWIRPVTSSAPSRLGNPITFASQGEIGLWTPRNGMVLFAQTQGRGLSGMGGRASADTNAWDPSQGSVAQMRWVSKATDIYRQFIQPPSTLSFKNKAERRKIFQFVYPADTRRENGGHVDLDSIDAEAVELMETDEPQAERFFGNRLVKGGGKAFDSQRWRDLRVTRPKVVPPGSLIAIGGDGSVRWDHFSLIATEIASGYQWPLGIWRPEDHGGEIPMAVVDAVVDQAFATFDVWRLYLDPPYIETWVAAWSGRYGRDRVVEWWTNRPKAMAYATRSWEEAQRKGEVSHCGEDHKLCALFTAHVGNAVKDDTGYKDDGGVLWVAKKDRKGGPDKMDSVPAAVLSWEARNDAITAGALNTESTQAYEGLTEEQVLGRMLGMTDEEIAARWPRNAAEVENA
jgi:hypothetical protein